MQNRQLWLLPKPWGTSGHLQRERTFAGAGLVGNGPTSSPTILSILSSRLFLSSCFILSIPLKSHSLHYRWPISEQVCVRSVQRFPMLSQAFLSSGSFPRGQRPHPHPHLQPLGRSLISLLRYWYPLLPSTFCCFEIVLIPQQSRKFSHLCLQDTFLNSKMWIIRIKRDEICTAPGTDPGLHPKLGTQLRSANTC